MKMHKLANTLIIIGILGTVLGVGMNVAHADPATIMPATSEYPTNVIIKTEIKKHDFDNVIKLLNNAKSGDSIVIQLDSTGGDVGTGNQLIDAMHNSKALVTTTVGYLDYAQSEAAMIFLGGDYKHMDDSGQLMFHMTKRTDGTPLTQNEIKVLHARDTELGVPHLLTPKEYSVMYNSPDRHELWMNGTMYNQRTPVKLTQDGADFR